MLHKKIQFFFLSSIFCFLSSVFSGCATSSLPLETYPAPAVSIGGVKYFSLFELCKKENIAWDYDIDTYTVTLIKKNTSLKLLIDSPLALYNSKIEDLKQPVKLLRGEIYLPQSFKTSALAKIFKMEKFEREKVIPPGFINKVCLDAGHGGKDPGAIGRYYGLKEKNVVLDIAMRMRRQLKEKGFEVITTRASDVFIPLERRADIANEAGADLFVSVHANASKRKALNGFEIYFIAEDADDLARSLHLAENGVSFPKNSGIKDPFSNAFSRNTKAIIWDLVLTQNRSESAKLAVNICRLSAEEAGVKILGVKGANFSVLRRTKMPAVLVEIGFISNLQEEKYFKNSFYREQIAEALVSGILAYKKKRERESKDHE